MKFFFLFFFLYRICFAEPVLVMELGDQAWLLEKLKKGLGIDLLLVHVKKEQSQSILRFNVRYDLWEENFFIKDGNQSLVKKELDITKFFELKMKEKSLQFLLEGEYVVIVNPLSQGDLDSLVNWYSKSQIGGGTFGKSGGVLSSNLFKKIIETNVDRTKYAEKVFRLQFVQDRNMKHTKVLDTKKR